MKFSIIGHYVIEYVLNFAPVLPRIAKSVLAARLGVNSPRADFCDELRVAGAEPLAAISNDRPKIGRGPNTHGDTLSTLDDKNKMSAFGDIMLREVPPSAPVCRRKRQGRRGAILTFPYFRCGKV
jgi:hypothetical protein